MTIWLDAHLSPDLATWMAKAFATVAISIRDLGLRDADDREIFAAAREAGVVLMTKDRDFVDLVSRQGPPPHVLWLTIGNTSNAHLRTILSARLRDALALITAGEPLVEIRTMIAGV